MVSNTLKYLPPYMLTYTTLGVDHPQGAGAMVKKDCNVIFTWICPLDLSATPYVLLTSHGTHNHPLPPPNKLPVDIAKELWDLIRRIKEPTLTTSMRTCCSTPARTC